MQQLRLVPHHFTISVSNLDSSIKWYSEVLGFQLEKIVHKTIPPADIAFLSSGGFLIEIICTTHSEARPAMPYEPAGDLSHQGIKYFAFGVDDVETAVSILEERGATFVTHILLGASNHRYAILLDNNGIPIEIFESKPRVVSNQNDD